MPKIYFTCTYCNWKWDDYYYTVEQAEAVQCPGCKDKHPKARMESEKGNYYGYDDAPISNPRDAWVKKK